MAVKDFFRFFNRRDRELQTHETPAQSFFNSLGSTSLRTDWDRRERFRQFHKMMTDTPVVAASTGRFFDFISASRMTLQAAEDDAEGEYAALMKRVLMDNACTPFDDIVSQTASAYLWGRVWIEFSIKIQDGEVSLDRTRTIPLYTVELPYRKNARGDITHIRQRQVGYTEPVDIDRNFCISLKADNALIKTDEGTGIFHHLLLPVNKLRNLEKLEEFAFTRDLQGIIKQKAAFREIIKSVDRQNNKLVEARRGGSESATAKLKELYAEAIEKAKEPGKKFAKALNDNKFTILITEESEPHIVKGTDNTERATTVPMCDTSFLEGSGGPHDVLLDKIQQAKHDITAIFETTDIQLGSRNVGTQAVGSTKYDIYEVRMNAVLNAVADALQRDLVTPFAIMNNVPENLIPRLVPQVARNADPVRSAGMVYQMTQAGARIPPDWKGWNDLLGKEGMPLMDMERVMEIEMERQEDRAFSQEMARANIESDTGDE